MQFHFPSVSQAEPTRVALDELETLPWEPLDGVKSVDGFLVALELELSATEAELAVCSSS